MGSGQATAMAGWATTRSKEYASDGKPGRVFRIDFLRAGMAWTGATKKAFVVQKKALVLSVPEAFAYWQNANLVAGRGTTVAIARFKANDNKGGKCSL